MMSSAAATASNPCNHHWDNNLGTHGSMGIQQKLHTKLVQKLILTPSLQQAIKLLPMSTLELSDLLNQEMVENPMLEEVPKPVVDRGAVGSHQPYL